MKDMHQDLLNILNTIVSVEMSKTHAERDSSLVDSCLRAIRRLEKTKGTNKKAFLFSSSWRKLYPSIKSFVDHQVDALFSGRKAMVNTGQIDEYMSILAEVRRLGKMDKDDQPVVIGKKPVAAKPLRYKKVLRASYIAASFYVVFCASLLFASGSWQTIDSLKDFLAIPYNVWVENDGQSIYKTDDVRTYGTLTALAEKENLDLLIPDYYPPQVVMRDASIAQVEQTQKIDIVSDDNQLRFSIELNAVKRIETFYKFYDDEEKIEINGVEIVVIEVDGVYQFDFVYHQDYYVVVFSDYDELTAVVASMTKYLR